MGRHPAERRVAEGSTQTVDRLGDGRVQHESDAEPAPVGGHGRPVCQAATL